MKKSMGLIGILVLGGLLSGCSGGDDNTNTTTNSATKNTSNTSTGIIETNANLPRNENDRNAPSNLGVVQNNNGNKNTAGISSINSNNHNASNTNNRNAANANSVANRH